MRQLSISLALTATVSATALPAEAVFLQVDPVGYADQMNLYAYVYNDPLNNTDPTGERGCDTCVPSTSQLRAANRSNARYKGAMAAQTNAIHKAQAQGAMAVGTAIAIGAAAPTVASAAAATSPGQGAFAGAVGSMGVEGAIQLSSGQADGGRLLTAGAAGAVTGGMASGFAAVAASPAQGGALGGALGGSVSGFGSALVNGGDPGAQALIGGATGMAGGALAPSATGMITQSSRFGPAGSITGGGAAIAAAAGEAGGAATGMTLQQFYDQVLKDED